MLRAGPLHGGTLGIRLEVPPRLFRCKGLRYAHIDQGSLQLLDFRGASDILRRWLGKASITRMLLNKCIAEPEYIPHPSRDSLTIGTFPKTRKQHRKRLASRLQHAECRGAFILASKEHSLDGLTLTGLFDGSSEARKGEHWCIPILSPKLEGLGTVLGSARHNCPGLLLAGRGSGSLALTDLRRFRSRRGHSSVVGPTAVGITLTWSLRRENHTAGWGLLFSFCRPTWYKSVLQQILQGLLDQSLQEGQQQLLQIKACK